MIYLNVSYDQKDDAKALGAKWDPGKKLWYAPDSSFTKLIETYSALVPKEKKTSIRKLETNEPARVGVLIGENINYGGNQLFVDLLPMDSNVTLKRSLSDSEYGRLKNIIVKRAGYKCEICNTECLSKDNKYLQVCERFSYCMEKGVQKLERIVAMCKDCFVTTRLLNKRVTLSRLIEINQIDKEDAKQHILDAYEIWKIRSNISWKVDLSMVSNFSNEKEKTEKIDKPTKIKINKLENSTPIIKDIEINEIKTSSQSSKITIHKLDSSGSKKEKCLIDDE